MVPIRDCSHLEWDAWDVSGMSLGLWDSGMEWTVGLQPSRVGHLGCVWDVTELPGTLGWDGQWDYSHLEWDALDMSGMSLGFLGLWDRMDSGIRAFTEGHSVHVKDVPGLPGTLGWDGQWD